MNIIFEKSSLKVISLLNSDHIKNSEDVMLQKMFPNNFKNLSVWHIDKTFNFNPIYLKIELDEDKNPDMLLFKNKAIYKLSEEEKKKNEAKRIEEGKKAISSFLPRTLRSSLNADVVKMWAEFPYTNNNIKKSLKDFRYFSDEKILPVSWWGTFVDAGGYGNMNRSFLFRLHNHHVISKAEIVPSLPQISPKGQYYISRYASFDFRRIKSYPKVYGFGPHPHSKHNGRNIFFTMMETETLHPTFRNICNQYADEIWVPSSHNKRVFEENGIKKPIYLMPLGIDEIIYQNTDSIEAKDLSKMVTCDILGKPASQGINSFRFFTLFGWSFRKGIDVLLKSFVKAFRGSDDVALVIFSNHVGPDRVVADAKRYASEIRKSDYPQILFIPGVTPEMEMPSLYKVGNAFLYTSRGEGFGLTPIEAAACGLPVISCNNTGMSEYLREDNSFIISTEEKEMCNPEMHGISGYYHGQLFPRLGECQIDQAVNHMRFVVNNYGKAIEKAKRLQALVYNQYTWQVATERVAKRLKEICQNA